MELRLGFTHAVNRQLGLNTFIGQSINGYIFHQRVTIDPNISGD